MYPVRVLSERDEYFRNYIDKFLNEKYSKSKCSHPCKITETVKDSLVLYLLKLELTYLESFLDNCVNNLVVLAYACRFNHQFEYLIRYKKSL